MKCCNSKAAELLSEDFFDSRMSPWNYQESKQDFVNNCTNNFQEFRGLMRDQSMTISCPGDLALV